MNALIVMKINKKFRNAAFHSLISPSKRAKGGEKELSARKEGGRAKKGKNKETWGELDEGDLERRRIQLQKELEVQNRQQIKKKANKKVYSDKKNKQFAHCLTSICNAEKIEFIEQFQFNSIFFQHE
jgi:hypothetical protein